MMNRGDSRKRGSSLPAGRSRFAWWRGVPLLLVMMVILYFSSQSGSSLPHLVRHHDKLLHTVAYGILAAATLVSIQPIRLPRLWLGLGTVVFCTGFGVLDELYQSRVLGRVASGWDVLADFGGAATVVVIWWLLTSVQKYFGASCCNPGTDRTAGVPASGGRESSL